MPLALTLLWRCETLLLTDRVQNRAREDACWQLTAHLMNFSPVSPTACLLVNKLSRLWKLG